MTTNEVAYWKLQEEKRANQVQEQELERSHKAEEQIKAADQASNARYRKTMGGVAIANAVTGGLSGLLSGAGSFMKGIGGLSGNG